MFSIANGSSEEPVHADSERQISAGDGGMKKFILRSQKSRGSSRTVRA
jgi:hypothetical protein